jgi:hypothetical protein
MFFQNGINVGNLLQKMEQGNSKLIDINFQQKLFLNSKKV